MTQGLLIIRAAAKCLGSAAITLHKARTEGPRERHLESPPFCKIERCVGHEVHGPREWFSQRWHEALPAELIR